jgi:uncharacterized protein YabE (DUF348 family)/3D (Asp-Asp-Asp) domain-containing protein
MQVPLSKRHRKKRAVLKILSYCLLVAALLSTLVFAFAADTAKSSSIATVADCSGEVSAQLTAAGVSCSDSDYISEGRGSGVYSLWISPSTNVSVTCGDSSFELTSYGESVGALLSRLQLEVGEHDLLTAGRASYSNPFQINLVHRTVEYLTVQETIARPVTYINSDTMYQTQETVVDEGSDGLRSCTYETVTLNGSYAVRNLTDVEILTDAVPQVVERGTKDLPALNPLTVSTDFLVNVEEDGNGGGVLTTLSGQQMTYTDVLTVKAYAYTTENKINKLTAIGTTARVGAIAENQQVIPYGTRMFIQTAAGTIIYGIATAEDCGNFRGYEIDLFSTPGTSAWSSAPAPASSTSSQTDPSKSESEKTKPPRCLRQRGGFYQTGSAFMRASRIYEPDWISGCSFRPRKKRDRPRETRIQTAAPLKATRKETTSSAQPQITAKTPKPTSIAR